MAIRIPTPATQGAQALGGVQAQPASTPYQDLSLPDTTFNSRMMQMLGERGIEFADYLRNQNDEQLLLELQNGVGDWERSLLYGENPTGEGDGTGGAFALKERDAFGLTERVETQFDEHLTQYNERLSGLSRSGRLAAQEFAQARRETLLDQAAKYEFQQREAYNARLRREAEEAAKRAAETAWASPEAMEAAEERFMQASLNRIVFETAGMTDTEERERLIEEAMTDARDQFHRIAIMRAVGQGEEKLGRELYEKAVESGAVTLEDDDLLTRVVQYGEQIDVVINGATDILQRHPDDFEAAVDLARSMALDGDTERDLVAEIERRFASQAAFEAQRREQLYEDARASAINGTLFDDFTAVQLAEFNASERSDLETLNSGAPVVGDTTLFRNLQLLSAEELAEYDLISAAPKLNDAQWQTILNAQRAARNALNTGQDYEWTGIRTEQTTLDSVITAMGIRSGSGARPRDVANRNEIYLLMEREKQRRLDRGESWTAKDMQAYADVLNTSTPYMEGAVWGKWNEPLWKILSGTVELNYVEGVPPSAVRIIYNNVATKGLDPTPELIRQVYEEQQRTQGN